MTEKRTEVPKKRVPKLTDQEQVIEFLSKMEHPLKPEIEAVREIICTSNGKISERIKWNGLSYYYKQDMVTFNHRHQRLHLVFHHPAIVKIKSDLLEGDYKDRRMTYFTDMAAIKANESELSRIMNELVAEIDAL